jgi:hypothetical protein
MTKAQKFALAFLVISTIGLCLFLLTYVQDTGAQGPVPTDAPLPGSPTPARFHQTPTPTPPYWSRARECKLPWMYCNYIPGIVGTYFFEHRPITVTGRLLSKKAGEPMAQFPVKWIDVYCNFIGQCVFVYSTAETPSTLTDAQGYFTKTFTPLTYSGIMVMVGYLDGAGGLAYYQVLLPVYPTNDPNMTALDLGTIYTDLEPLPQTAGAEIVPAGMKLIIKNGDKQ